MGEAGILNGFFSLCGFTVVCLCMRDISVYVNVACVFPCRKCVRVCACMSIPFVFECVCACLFMCGCAGVVIVVRVHRHVGVCT